MRPGPRDIVDDRLVRGLHVAAARRGDVHPEHEDHLFFQASTLDALLAGGFEGDLTIAELAEHGDFGLGTLNGLDGELIAVDGRFLRADADGRLGDVPPGARTPFAVVAFFAPTVEVVLDDLAGHEELVAALDAHVPAGSSACAVRLDGTFAAIRARSVPRHEPPYPPLSAIAHEQHVFDLHDVEGTVVGFRFPLEAEGLEVAGYHLHFADAARRRGGHVLACRPERVTARLDPARELHVELPPAVALEPDHPDAGARERIRELEGG